MKNKAIGIDLGTTYSCVSYVDDSGNPRILLNSDGERTTPSVVWFDDDRDVVGREAKEESSLSPSEVASFIKRYMGDAGYSFKCRKGKFRPEEISALILKKLVQDAESRLGFAPKEAVITCPAYFSHKEREATRLAGELAGLKVLEILNEPTAAAIAYGITRKHGEGVRHVLVYDLGGGTFDVTLLQIAPEGMTVIASDGNHFLGGKDWDEEMLQLLVSRLQRSSSEHVDLLSDDATRQDLVLLAEKVKKELSARQETRATYIYQGEKLYAVISRSEFNDRTDFLLQRTIKDTHHVLDIAKAKGVNNIDELILVGGSCYMPQVGEALRREFSIVPKLFDPDEAVAKGAALRALALSIREQLPGGIELVVNSTDSGVELPVIQKIAEETGIGVELVGEILKPVSNVCSRSFGFLLFPQHEKEYKESNMRIFNAIYRNTNLPTEVMMPTTTIDDNQTHVRVQLYDNMQEYPTDEREAMELMQNGIDKSEGTLLWEGLLPIKRGLPKGSLIETVLKMDASGLLSILSRDPASGNELPGELQTDCSISAEEFKKMEDKISRRCVE